MTEELHRGDRSVPHLDLATRPWTPTEHGAGVEVASRDPVSGALTFILKTPPGMRYPERAHFYDCDEDLFVVAGEYHHDPELPMRAGDYVWRPPGSVYGHDQGTEGATIIVALSRQPRRFHFSEDPEPWAGEYLVDAAWNPRAERRMHVASADIPWQPVADAVSVKPLRGMPGATDAAFGARSHSPWGADAACLVRLAAGYRGPLNPWPGWIAEHYVLAGRATDATSVWAADHYHFGTGDAEVSVADELLLFTRLFAPLYR